MSIRFIRPQIVWPGWTLSLQTTKKCPISKTQSHLNLWRARLRFPVSGGRQDEAAADTCPGPEQPHHRPQRHAHLRRPRREVGRPHSGWAGFESFPTCWASLDSNFSGLRVIFSRLGSICQCDPLRYWASRALFAIGRSAKAHFLHLVRKNLGKIIIGAQAL